MLPRKWSQPLLLASGARDKTGLQVTCIVGDSEAWTLAEQIKSAFEQAGITFHRVVAVITPPPFSGIRIASKDYPSPSPLHNAVGIVLKHFDLALSAEPLPDTENFVWTIRVSKKP